MKGSNVPTGRLIVLAMLAAALVLLVGCGGGSSPTTTNGMTTNGTTTTPDILALENRAFDLVNDARAANSLPALTVASDVRDVARAHSQDMATRDFFSHTNPDGGTPWDRLATANISYVAAAENIAMNLNMPDPAQTAVSGWLASPGHYANIMNTTVDDAPLGIAQAQNGSFYLTQVFIKRP